MASNPPPSPSPLLQPRLSVRETSRWEDLEPHRAEWNRLAEQCEAEIFQTFEWNQCWWRAFGKEGRLCVLLVFEETERERKRLIAVAPLAIERSFVNGFPQRVLRLIGSSNHSSDYCDFLFARDRPEALIALLQWIVDHRVKPATGRRLWDQIDWLNIPSHSPTLAVAEPFLARSGLAVECHKLVEAPARVLDDPAGNRELLAKKSLKRHFNSFQKSGRLEFRVCRTLAEIEQWLDAFFEQHVGRRALTSAPSLFEGDPGRRQRGFYRDLAASLQPAGWLHFSVVLHDERPIAFHFGFEYRRKLIWYKPSFDARLVRRSPGEVLLRFLFQDCIDRGLREFDFTVGNEEFKYRFANRIRSNHRLRAYGSRFHHALFRLRRLLSSQRAFQDLRRSLRRLKKGSS